MDARSITREVGSFVVGSADHEIDNGEEPGVSSTESDELRGARRRSQTTNRPRAGGHSWSPTATGGQLGWGSDLGKAWKHGGPVGMSRSFTRQRPLVRTQYRPLDVSPGQRWISVDGAGVARARFRLTDHKQTTNVCSVRTMPLVVLDSRATTASLRPAGTHGRRKGAWGELALGGRVGHAGVVMAAVVLVAVGCSDDSGDGAAEGHSLPRVS